MGCTETKYAAARQTPKDGLVGDTASLKRADHQKYLSIGSENHFAPGTTIFMVLCSASRILYSSGAEALKSQLEQKIVAKSRDASHRKS